jgi:protein-disulfide isomerase
VHYNERVSKPRVSGHVLLALVLTPVLMGAACEKKSAKAGDTGAINALDRANGSGSAGSTAVKPAPGPVDKTPLPGIDITRLDADKQELFYKLLGSLTSPCGQGHSLRVSFSKDTSCKRAPFAVRYVESLLEDEVPEAELREFYDKKYKNESEAVKLDVSHAPHEGPTDAPVRIYEFYDYECPHCKMFKPMLEQVMADEKNKVVQYFMQFPLEKHTDSKSAAQAALAAAKQGKFKQMHDMLFDKTPEHSHDSVTEYAKQLGLDIGKFESDYNAAKAEVEADVAQGEKAGVDATPTLFFNDHKYEGPMHPRYIEMWIEEEVAVNR